MQHSDPKLGCIVIIAMVTVKFPTDQPWRRNHELCFAFNTNDEIIRNKKFLFYCSRK